MPTIHWGSSMLRSLLLVLFLCGCQLTVPPEAAPSPSASKDTVWTNIADAIDSGQVENSTVLSLMVGHLRAMDKVSDSEVSNLWSQLPDKKTSELTLTKEDSIKIRGL